MKTGTAQVVISVAKMFLVQIQLTTNTVSDTQDQQYKEISAYGTFDCYMIPYFISYYVSAYLKINAASHWSDSE